MYGMVSLFPRYKLMQTVSVVTINRNNSIGLEKTLLSIIAQTYSYIELVIVDGASVDGSVNVINKIVSNNQGLVRVLAISEPDSGIYNAMNKGLKNSTGDYVCYLNSGDIFFDKQAVENVFSHFNNEDVLYGNLCIHVGSNLKTIKSNPEVRFFDKYQHDLPPHPAMFVRRSRILEVGGFEEEYKIIADVVLISRLFSNRNLSYKCVDIPITIFDLSGVSSKIENQMLIYGERKKFISRNYPHFIKDLEKVYRYRKVYFLLTRFRFIRIALSVLKRFIR